MRPLLPTALILSTVLFAAAQDDIPLPQSGEGSLLPPAQVEELPPLPDAERPVPAEPGLPKVRVAPNAPAKATPAPRVRMSPGGSITESSVHGGQFRIHGKVKSQRDILLDEAETTRRMVAVALRQSEPFEFPIVVQIRDTEALRPGRAGVWSVISQTPGGFRFEINIVPLRNTVDGPLLRQELVRCILAEMLLRGHAEADMSGRDVPPPDWLLHGVLELLDYQALGRPSEAFSTVSRLGRVLSIEDIFAADPDGMDSVTRMIYRSSCCGLLLMLMEQPNGGRLLRDLMKTLATVPDDTMAIARVYPHLTGSGNSLGKWWSLQLASLAQPGMDELLGSRETEQELAKALVMELPPEPVAAEKKKAKGGALSRILGGRKKKEADKKEAEKPKGEKLNAEKENPPAAAQAPVPVAIEEYPIEDYARILKRKDRVAILARVDLALTNLALRAHPLYRPVLSEYRAIIKNLSAGKKEKEAGASLNTLAGLRKRLIQDVKGIEDYLDWYEATQSEGLSGAFHDYLKTAEEVSRPLPPRRDPVSRYMNLMEQEYREEEE